MRFKQIQDRFSNQWKNNVLFNNYNGYSYRKDEKLNIKITMKILGENKFLEKSYNDNNY